MDNQTIIALAPREQTLMLLRGTFYGAGGEQVSTIETQPDTFVLHGLFRDGTRYLSLRRATKAVAALVELQGGPYYGSQVVDVRDVLISTTKDYAAQVRATIALSEDK